MTKLDFMASTILEMSEDELKAFSMSLNVNNTTSKRRIRKEDKKHD